MTLLFFRKRFAKNVPNPILIFQKWAFLFLPSIGVFSGNLISSKTPLNWFALREHTASRIIIIKNSFNHSLLWYNWRKKFLVLPEKIKSSSLLSRNKPVKTEVIINQDYPV